MRALGHDHPRFKVSYLYIQYVTLTRYSSPAQRYTCNLRHRGVQCSSLIWFRQCRLHPCVPGRYCCWLTCGCYRRSHCVQKERWVRGVKCNYSSIGHVEGVRTSPHVRDDVRPFSIPNPSYAPSVTPSDGNYEDITDSVPTISPASGHEAFGPILLGTEMDDSAC